MFKNKLILLTNRTIFPLTVIKIIGNLSKVVIIQLVEKAEDKSCKNQADTWIKRHRGFNTV